MPTITINTNTQPSGISYAWDRDWDIKTVADARRAYLRLRDKLASIPETLKRMEALAAKDGFALPVEDFGAVFDQLARTALLANPDRLLVLSVDPD